MEITAANSWSPPEGWASIKVVDSHAGGEPFRVVTDGLPEIPGDTVLDRRRYASQHLDHLRQALMWEPRGHRDMYGGWIGAPVTPDSDFSILFTHNEGYSTMCGHGIIAATKVVLDTGMMPISSPETTVRIDTPAGQVTSVAVIVDGAVARVRFRNVASFVDGLDELVEVDGVGAVTYDLAFGGAYYAYVDAPSLGIPWPPTDTLALIDYGRRIKRAIAEHVVSTIPDTKTSGFSTESSSAAHRSTPTTTCATSASLPTGRSIDRRPGPGCLGTSPSNRHVAAWLREIESLSRALSAVSSPGHWPKWPGSAIE